MCNIKVAGFRLILTCGFIFVISEAFAQAQFQFIGELNGHGYFVSTETKTWAEAKTICERHGGHLVTIADSLEEAIVTEGAKQSPDGVWIGFTDKAREGKFKWVTREPVTYLNWGPGEPNNSEGDEDHVQLISNPLIGNGTYWNDARGAEFNFLFVMEVESPFVLLGKLKGHRYLVSTTKKTWADARTICDQNRGHLATIEDEAEESLVTEGAMFDPDGVWIGFTDQETEGNFQWVTGEGVTYTNWGPGEPNDSEGDEDQVHLIHNTAINNGRYWNDARGWQYSHLFVCEVPRRF